MDRRCYHPHISGAEAEQLLKTFGEDGSFLCRSSGEETSTYTLSILNKKEVIHLRMKHVERHFKLCDGELFQSPFDVIQHHHSSRGSLRDKSGTVYYLGKPLIREVHFSARWYHGDIGADVVEALLKGRGQDGSFLVRSSYSSPGDYSLCVRSNDEVVNVKIHGRGKKFDLGGGKQFDSIEDLVEYYKKYPFSTGEGKQVHLRQGLECATGSTSRQTSSTDGAVMSCHTTIHRYAVPTFPQLEDEPQLQSMTGQKLQSVTSGPGSWECKGICTLNIPMSNPDGKSTGMIAICGTAGNYSLNLDGNGGNDERGWFKLTYKLLFTPNEYTLYRLESYHFPGNYLSWDSRLDIIFIKDQDGSQNDCWYVVSANTNKALHNLQAATTQNSPPNDYKSRLFLTFKAPDALYKPVLTTSPKTASGLMVTVIKNG